MRWQMYRAFGPPKEIAYASCTPPPRTLSKDSKKDERLATGTAAHAMLYVGKRAGIIKRAQRAKSGKMQVRVR